MLTERLELRLPVESDRGRFVELFCDAQFMVFHTQVNATVKWASDRFDRMIERATEFPFAKQPVIERSTGIIIGYAGVDWMEFEGNRWMEFGYRLVPAARGKGYATEAGSALLSLAARTASGEILAVIDPNNTASTRTAEKLGFTFWKQAQVGPDLCNISRQKF
jgi:RimJ/RimL family protein N-acetyltransferase